MSKKPSLSNLILAYFEKRPYIKLAHDDWIDEIMRQYEELHGRIPRDPWRAARKLHEEGKLQKVRKGVYMYDPHLVFDRQLEEFTEQQKQAIFARDNYQCIECGKGRDHGVELHVDHFVPKDKGGRAIIDNGVTLCSEHNFLKKNMDATTSGKRLFIRLYEAAKREDNRKYLAFSKTVLDLYDEFDVNGHIEWDE